MIGFSENQNGWLYISQAIIDKDEEIKLKRRKCNLTHVEKIMYGEGDADNLKAVTSFMFNRE